jgi:hypothetical protein
MGVGVGQCHIEIGWGGPTNHGGGGGAVSIRPIYREERGVAYQLWRGEESCRREEADDR